MNQSIVPDSEARGLLARLPETPRILASLARLDRPIGWWLLFWPGAWAVALAGDTGVEIAIDDVVEDAARATHRDAARPLASGAMSVKTAWAWLLALCLIGLIVLFQLSLYAQVVALGSLALVAAYPFMKRITGWPQVWLGIVFSWAALVGWSEIAGALTLPGLCLYAGCIFWVLGYDTIYALQDREDDALIGIGSSALSMGRHVRGGVTLCYLVALALWASAIWQVRPQLLALVALAPMAAHLLWQVGTLKEDGTDPLVKFRSNRFAGLLMFLACLVVGSAGA